MNLFLKCCLTTIMFVLTSCSATEEGYKKDIEKAFSMKVKSISFKSHITNIPTYTVEEEQGILIIKLWLLSAKKISLFNLTPYPDALDKLIVNLDNGESIIIKISQPTLAYSTIEFMSNKVVSTSLPDSIKEIKNWKQAYKDINRIK